MADAITDFTKAVCGPQKNLDHDASARFYDELKTDIYRVLDGNVPTPRNFQAITSGIPPGWIDVQYQRPYGQVGALLDQHLNIVGSALTVPCPGNDHETVVFGKDGTARRF